MNQSAITEFHELSFYTLSHPNPTYFLHQHIVDAFHAQTANEHTKPITILFSLIGLHLYLEKGYSGREVQLAHIKLAKHKKAWAPVQLPKERGSITVSEVLSASAGADRDQMIREWCASVWAAFSNEHAHIAQIVKDELR